MNTTRILTVCMATLLVAGGAALAAEPAPDPRTTVLPIYTLPAGKAEVRLSGSRSTDLNDTEKNQA